MSSALRNLTEPTQCKTFKSFTVAETQTIDHSIDKIFSIVSTLYKSKESEAS